MMDETRESENGVCVLTGDEKDWMTCIPQPVGTEIDNTMTAENWVEG